METIGAMPAAALAAITALLQKILGEYIAPVFEVIINTFAEWGRRGICRTVFSVYSIFLWQGFVFSGEVDAALAVPCEGQNETNWVVGQKESSFF